MEASPHFQLPARVREKIQPVSSPSSQLGRGAVIAAVALLSGCHRAPADPGTGAAASNAVSTAAPPVSAVPPPEPAAPQDAASTCARVASTPFPPGDLPTAEERRALGGCDSEALYYGIGRAPDFAAARKCAHAEMGTPREPVHGGAAVLMMIYANGKGVPRSFDLALRLACTVGGAPMELESRVSYLVEARGGGKLRDDFDLCDDATSGYLTGFCAGHVERIEAVKRDARKAAAARGLDTGLLRRLDGAARAYFDARAMGEVDLSGTMRGALSLGERAKLEEAHVAMLESLANPSWSPAALDAGAVQRELDDTWRALLACMKARPVAVVMPGSVEVEGIRKTQQLWLAYREAWLSLVARARPGAKRDAWKAWLTQSRTKLLVELKDLC